jgi:4-carboxymuconolactone decarboxylase
MPDDPAPRVKPIWPPDWTDEIRDALSVLPHARDNVLNTWKDGTPGIYGTNMLCTQLLHPALAKAFFTFNGHHFYASTLSARPREIAIMRIGWLCRSEYEYLAHVDLGKQAGLSDDEIEWVRQGPTATGWAPADAALMQAVDELFRDQCIGDAAFDALIQHFEHRQIMDLIGVVGCYQLLAMFLRTYRVQFEPSVQRLDSALRARLQNQ